MPKFAASTFFSSLYYQGLYAGRVSYLETFQILSVPLVQATPTTLLSLSARQFREHRPFQHPLFIHHLRPSNSLRIISSLPARLNAVQS